MKKIYYSTHIFAQGITNLGYWIQSKSNLEMNNTVQTIMIIYYRYYPVAHVSLNHRHVYCVDYPEFERLNEDARAKLLYLVSEYSSTPVELR